MTPSEAAWVRDNAWTAPRIGSLCTGYGGLDMAVMDVCGGTVAWHCQYDPDDRHQYAARILDHHWPDVPNHGDITAVDWTRVEPVDVLTAGFPCQDLSYAGRGAGIKEGTRSGLWYTVARAIGALRPRLGVLENVRAVVSRRPGLDVVLADLARLGFDAEWTCVRASDVGAPHQRERWFLLAWPADTEGPRCEGPWLRGRPPVDGGDAAAHADRVGRQRHRAAGLAAQRHAARPGSPAAADAAGDGRREGRPESTGIERGSHAAICGSSAHGGGREAVTGVTCIEWGAYGPAVRRWERILGRLAPSPVDDRGRLAPEFAEWMMGLPAGHVTDVPAPPGMTPAGLRNARLKALGNGVVTEQAAYALRLLLARELVPLPGLEALAGAR